MGTAEMIRDEDNTGIELALMTGLYWKAREGVIDG